MATPRLGAVTVTFATSLAAVSAAAPVRVSTVAVTWAISYVPLFAPAPLTVIW